MVYSGCFIVLSIMLFTGTAVAAALAVVSSSTVAVSAVGGGGRQLIYGGWWLWQRHRPCTAAVVGWPMSADGSSVSSVPVRWLVSTGWVINVFITVQQSKSFGSVLHAVPDLWLTLFGCGVSYISLFLVVLSRLLSLFSMVVDFGAKRVVFSVSLLV